MKRICLLGSTGSIGTNTLDIIERNSSRFEVEIDKNRNLSITGTVVSAAS